MSEDAEKKEDAIHRVDTVPPPPGEGDAYSAPTTVGPVNDAVIEAMRKAGVPEDLIPQSQRAPTSGPASGSRPIVPTAALEAAPPADVPRVYDSGEDEDDAPTILHPSAAKIPLAIPIPSTVPAPPMPVRGRLDPPRLVALVFLAALAVLTLFALFASLR